jgi:hypothetical protein
MVSAGRALIGAPRQHKTPFAFEIHVQRARGGKAKVLTMCTDSHQQRRAFIRTLQNALVTRAEVDRMRHRLAPDAVRAVHSRMGQKRRDAVTIKITDTMATGSGGAAAIVSLGVPLFPGRRSSGSQPRLKSGSS